MLKHVQISPMRNISDIATVKSSRLSFCESPEPPYIRAHSRSSSYSSLDEIQPQVIFNIEMVFLEHNSTINLKIKFFINIPISYQKL